MIIAVQGAPCSGKTSFCINLGRELQKEKHEAVIVLFIEQYCPEMNRLFPGDNNSASLGEVLDRGLNDQNMILRSVRTLPETPNLGFMGYLSDDDKKYAALTRPGIEDFLSALQTVAPFVIADFGNEEANLLGKCLLDSADRIITVLSADLHSASWFGKGRRSLGNLVVQNMTEKNMSPLDLKDACSGQCFTLSYSADIARSAKDGTMIRTLPSGKYMKDLRKVVHAL